MRYFKAQQLSKTYTHHPIIDQLTFSIEKETVLEISK